MYVNKMDRAITIPKYCLKITCSWPSDEQRFVHKFIAISWVFIAFLYTLLMYMETVISIRNNNILKISKILYLPLMMTSYLAKFINFVYNKRYVVELLQLLNEKRFYDNSQKLNNHILDAIKFSNILAKCYMIMVTIAVTVYLTTPLISGSRNLPTPIAIDFGNYLPLIYLIQLIGLAHATFANAALDLLYVSFVLLGSCQFDILNNKIRNLRNEGTEEDEKEFINDLKINGTDEEEEEDRKLMQNLTNIVKHHNLIIKYIFTFTIFNSYYFFFFLQKYEIFIADFWNT